VASEQNGVREQHLKDSKESGSNIEPGEQNSKDSAELGSKMQSGTKRKGLDRARQQNAVRE